MNLCECGSRVKKESRGNQRVAEYDSKGDIAGKKGELAEVVE